MYEGNTVISKLVTEPIDWNTHKGVFAHARHVPFLEAVNLVKSNPINMGEISLVGKVFRRWPFYYDITGKFKDAQNCSVGRLRFSIFLYI